MSRFTATLIAITVLTLSTAARTRTTQSQLRTTSIPVERIAADTTADSIAGVSPDDVTLRGYSKRASDSRESFFITNNTTHRITGVRLQMRYSALDGSMLHERVATVDADLKSGESRLVTVSTFDVQRLFYYYAGPKPRKRATPFKVSYRLLGYSIPVGR